MKIKKTWLTVHFSEGKAYIEATLNYETKSYTLTHGSNDNNVTFTNDGKETMAVHFDRLKCVTAALKFIQSELSL